MSKRARLPVASPRTSRSTGAERRLEPAFLEEKPMSVRAIARDWSPSNDHAPGVLPPEPAAPQAALHADLSLELLSVVEQAALAAAQTTGLGDRHESDRVAVEAMRRALGALPIDGTIVIGEGERDQAPMLYIGEKLGSAQHGRRERVPEVDIAVDPLEGTNLCATGEPNAIAVLAASERGGLLHAPDLYMEKLIVGPAARGLVDLDAPVHDNLRAIARSLQLRVEDLVVTVLDRPRHEQLIQQIRATGARIRLISDGDLAAGIAAARGGTGVHAVMGTGGAPEGVLTAAALRCLGGEILARLVVDGSEHEARCRAMGISDFRRVYRARDLAPGKHIVFAATGVTDGSLLDGVRRSADGARTLSLVLQTEPRRMRFIETLHVQEPSET
jgi:fructose-1,6-bisphosphatase class II